MLDSYRTRIDMAKKALEEAEYILLGGGAGLSAAAGYGFANILPSASDPLPTWEERWAYWAGQISLNVYEAGPASLYKDVLQLVKDKAYFVITTNVEGQFDKAGFPAGKVLEILGNCGYRQCARGCHDKLYDNENLVKDLVAQTVDRKIPSGLVPECPLCGGEMVPTVSPYFIHDEKWYEIEALYHQFVRDSIGKKRVSLELGVEREASVQLENEDRTIAFTEDMQEVISALLRGM